MPADLERVIDFLVAEFAREAGVQPEDPLAARTRWRWSLADHPGRREDALPSWICLDVERVVGHVGAFPCDISVRGDVRGMAWARDLIVSPDARGRGVGSRLMRTVTQAYARSGVLGHADTYGLYRQIGYLDMGSVPLFLKVRRASVFARAFAPRPGLREAVSLALPLLQMRLPRGRPTLRVEHVTAFDEEFDRWWLSLEPDLGCVIRRTSRTMQWRYLSNPSGRHRVLAARDGTGLRGIVVVRPGSSRGVPVGIIAEVLAHPADHDVMLELISAGEQELFGSPGGRDIVFVRANVLHGSFGRAFIRAGYIPAPSPIKWILAGADGAASLQGLLEAGRWFVNGGDSDVDLL